MLILNGRLGNAHLVMGTSQIALRCAQSMYCNLRCWQIISSERVRGNILTVLIKYDSIIAAVLFVNCE